MTENGHPSADKVMIYIPGKGGNAAEAEHYAPLFPDCRVIGFDYRARTPWEAAEEFGQYFAAVCESCDWVGVIANSIGAFFLMNTPGLRIQKACFISPIVDMEGLILRMMGWANVTEEMLQARGNIPTDFGETLSWQYLTYVRDHPLHWTVPTCILYGERDTMTDYAVMAAFAAETGAGLEVMPEGEHWFHTEAQMDYLDSWIRKIKMQ